jgi:hypothetical protein
MCSVVSGSTRAYAVPPLEFITFLSVFTGSLTVVFTSCILDEPFVTSFFEVVK